MRSVEIIIATHKNYDFPKEKSYLPLQVGAANTDNDLGIEKDNTYDNISSKNPYFCELTGLYWAWKNVNADYVGLVHYRRHFTLRSGKIKQAERLKSALSDIEITDLIGDYDLILPKKRNYYIETLYSHYEHTLFVAPLLKTREIIEKLYPEYLEEFDRLKVRKSAHMFNMLIAKKEILNEYCSWLFNILFTLEEEIKEDPEFVADYDQFHARFYGRISELLFDVWLYTKYPSLRNSELSDDEIRVKELRVIDIENVNWLKKGTSFLLAKYGKKKYGKSF